MGHADFKNKLIPPNKHPIFSQDKCRAKKLLPGRAEGRMASLKHDAASQTQLLKQHTERTTGSLAKVHASNRSQQLRLHKTASAPSKAQNHCLFLILEV